MTKYVPSQYGKEQTLTYVNLSTDVVGQVGAGYSTEVILDHLVAYCEPKPGEFFPVEYDSYQPPTRHARGEVLIWALATDSGPRVELLAVEHLRSVAGHCDARTQLAVSSVRGQMRILVAD